MDVTWVMGLPNGREQGRILAIDMGGTNIRVCDVHLGSTKRDFKQTQKKYTLPVEIKIATAEQLWDWIAERVQLFLNDHDSGGQRGDKIPLAVTLSYPMYQKTIRSGVLQHWTKDFSVAGVEGQDVAVQVEAALDRKVCFSNFRRERDWESVTYSSRKFPRGSSP